MEIEAEAAFKVAPAENFSTTDCFAYFVGPLTFLRFLRARKLLTEIGKNIRKLLASPKTMLISDNVARTWTWAHCLPLVVRLSRRIGNYNSCHRQPGISHTNLAACGWDTAASHVHRNLVKTQRSWVFGQVIYWGNCRNF